MASLSIRHAIARNPCLKWFGVLVVGAALSGCSTMRPPLNQPLNQTTSSESNVAEYRLRNLAPKSGNSDSLVVILTFSGGGN